LPIGKRFSHQLLSDEADKLEASGVTDFFDQL